MEKWSEEGWERRQQAFLIFFSDFFYVFGWIFCVRKIFFWRRGLLGCFGVYWCYISELRAVGGGLIGDLGGLRQAPEDVRRAREAPRSRKVIGK